MAATDFISASGWQIDANAAVGDTTITLGISTASLSAGLLTEAGMRVKVTLAAQANRIIYYTLQGAATAALVSGARYNYVVRVAGGVRSGEVPADGDQASFEPYVKLKGTVPNQTVKQHEYVRFDAQPYFEYIGSQTDQLTYTMSVSATPTNATFSISGTSTVQIFGRLQGQDSGLLEATDKTGLTLTQRFAVTVTQANRAPVNINLFSPVTVGPGGIYTYASFDNYFSDPDGDTLTVTATASDTTVRAVISNNALSIHGLAPGNPTIKVIASDGSLAAEQTIHVTVTPNQPPVVRKAFANNMGYLILGGPARELNLTDHFHDPDGGHLAYRVEWQRPAAHVTQQQADYVFWRVRGKGSGSNNLQLESVFNYPVPPWSTTVGGSGTAWTVDDQTKISVWESGIARTEYEVHSSTPVTVTWNQSNGKLRVELPTNDALPADAAAITGYKTILWTDYLSGRDIDDWMTPSIDQNVLTLTPGTAWGGAQLAITAADIGDAEVTDDLPIHTTRRPVYTMVPNQIVEVGDDLVVALDDYFTDPDGDKLTYRVTAIDNALLLDHIDGSTLHLHGLAQSFQRINILATDPYGATVLGEFAVVVNVTNVARATPLVSESILDRVDTLIRAHGERLRVVWSYQPPDVVIPAVTATQTVTLDFTGVYNGADSMFNIIPDSDYQSRDSSGYTTTVTDAGYSDLLSRAVGTGRLFIYMDRPVSLGGPLVSANRITNWTNGLSIRVGGTDSAPVSKTYNNAYDYWQDVFATTSQLDLTISRNPTAYVENDRTSRLTVDLTNNRGLTHSQPLTGEFVDTVEVQLDTTGLTKRKLAAHPRQFRSFFGSFRADYLVQLWVDSGPFSQDTITTIVTPESRMPQAVERREGYLYFMSPNLLPGDYGDFDEYQTDRTYVFEAKPFREGGWLEDYPLYRLRSTQSTSDVDGDLTIGYTQNDDANLWLGDQRWQLGSKPVRDRRYMGKIIWYEAEAYPTNPNVVYPGSLLP